MYSYKKAISISFLYTDLALIIFLVGLCLILSYSIEVSSMEQESTSIIHRLCIVSSSVIWSFYLHNPARGDIAFFKTKTREKCPSLAVRYICANIILKRLCLPTS